MSNSNQSTPNLNNTDDEPWLSFIPSSTKQHKKAASKATPIASTSSLDLAVESKPDLPALLPKSLWKVSPPILPDRRLTNDQSYLA